MHHLATFLQDLAVIMLVAGVVTIIFHQLKQPVVLGYIISGLILGRHTPPYSFIHDETTVKTLAELGVIFLMFSLGLEFSIRKLFRVGIPAILAALAEIIFMILIGYELGQAFGWSSVNSLFLGSMLAISSTTIIIKALDELGMKRESFSQIIFGILIIEDILAIAILALLSSIAISGSLESFSLVDMAATIGKLIVFLVSALVIGILIVPKVLAYVSRFNSNEMLLITVLGFCFGFSLLVIKLGYSVALGAFLMGAIIAESRNIKLIEKLVNPITNMFSAIFFVSIGLLVDPHVIINYIIPITLITLAVVLGKVFICSLAVFLAGRDGRTSMRVGMGLAQIGEFSFIIASLGINLKVTSAFLYPIIVAVSAVTTFLTPYLIKLADPLTTYLARKTPPRLAQVFNAYTAWLQTVHYDQQHILLVRTIKKSLLQIFINLILIIAIFIGGSFLAYKLKSNLIFITEHRLQDALIWGLALIISLPFLIAVYQKLKALSMILAELTVKLSTLEQNTTTYHAIAEIIPVACMLGVILMIIALSASILPPFELLALVSVIVISLAAILWRWFVRLHSQLQIAFMQNFDKNNEQKNPKS